MATPLRRVRIPFPLGWVACHMASPCEREKVEGQRVIWEEAKRGQMCVDQTAYA
jgi:hypothetical protein